MTGKKLEKYLIIILLAVSLVWAGSAVAQEKPAESTDSKTVSSANDWEFEIALYGFMPAIKGETESGSDIDMSFDDILDNLDFTLQGFVGVSRDKWSFMVDAIYLDMSAKDSGTMTAPLIGPITITEKVKVDIDMQAWVVSPTVGYNLVDNEHIHLTLVAGARYLWMKAKLKIDNDTILAGRRFGRSRYRQHKESASGDVWDAIVGVRGYIPLTDKWYLPYYADIGTGESDLTWQVFGGVGYRFKYCDLVGGYRYLEWDMDSDSAIKELYLTGPIVGVKFSF